MPKAARGESKDVVKSETGAGFACGYELVTSTNECSDNVFVNSIGSVRVGDAVTEHTIGGCLSTEAPPLKTGSPTVFVNGKQMGRLGDNYIESNGNNIIDTGSENVFVNG